MSVRVDRVERELEYLENKIPSQSDIEMEEALLEQQIMAAEQDQLKMKSKIQLENGRKCVCAVSNVYVCMWEAFSSIIGLEVQAWEAEEENERNKIVQNKSANRQK